MAKKENNRIEDLPSSRVMSEQLAATRLFRGVADCALKLGVGGEAARKIVEGADEILARAEIVGLPDRFNAAFSKRGWIATSSMPTDAIRNALRHHEEGNDEAAETAIIEGMTSQVIDLAIMQSKRFSQVHGRFDQLREALALTEEERYWSAVPLILIACDGLASEKLGKSPFSKDEPPLALFDSMVGHATGLPVLIAQASATIKVSSDEILSLPQRHGILHGRSLGYANRAVCFKAWMLLMAIVDWAADKEDEDTRRKTDETRRSTNWRDLATALAENHSTDLAIRNFKDRQWPCPLEADLAEDEPPFIFRDFLSGWSSGNYGRMAKHTLYVLQTTSIKKAAGELRSLYGGIELASFEILSVTQTAVSRAEARVRMSGRNWVREIHGEFLVVTLRLQENGSPALPSDSGSWQIQPRFILDFSNNKRIDI